MGRQSAVGDSSRWLIDSLSCPFKLNNSKSICPISWPVFLLYNFWKILQGTLVARIARPTSLAIWHRGRSHRRPNRSGSPNRKHFASLDLKKHPDFSRCGPIAQDFRSFCFFFFFIFLAFSCDFRSSEYVFASLEKNKKKFASLAIWGCAIRITSYITIASRDLGH